MRHDRLKDLLEGVKRQDLDVEDAMQQLRTLPFKDLEIAKIDAHRELRQGFPEVIFGEGKDVEKLSIIISEICSGEQNIMVTRLDAEKASQLLKAFPGAEYFSDARLMRIINHEIKNKGRGNILVLSAGTSDIPVAEEAVIVAETLGNKVERIYDVGVAGIHRLLAHHEKIDAASVIIVVAGMEGALPSVVGGLVAKPLIAVPTSIGYGASFGGISALLGMLNSCAAGVTVVNIDNGFGAAYAASLINRK
ncbi:MAG: nickel pincer cofactor biosynthesis protein LarB [Proteobacteria bacterium]|nr:nickel pincer cofactor biosynthesis protein LarB [Pseudomonadota bacterium]